MQEQPHAQINADELRDTWESFMRVAVMAWSWVMVAPALPMMVPVA